MPFSSAKTSHVKTSSPPSTSKNTKSTPVTPNSAQKKSPVTSPTSGKKASATSMSVVSSTLEPKLDHRISSSAKSHLRGKQNSQPKKNSYEPFSAKKPVKSKTPPYAYHTVSAAKSLMSRSSLVKGVTS